MNQAEETLLALARELGPELIQNLSKLLKGALDGQPEDLLKREAEKLAVLAVYKASYRNVPR